MHSSEIEAYAAEAAGPHFISTRPTPTTVGSEVLYSEHYIGYIIPIMLKNHSKYLKVNPGFLREKLQNIYNVMHFLDVLTFSKCLRNRQSIISRRRLNHLNIVERINL